MMKRMAVVALILALLAASTMTVYAGPPGSAVSNVLTATVKVQSPSSGGDGGGGIFLPPDEPPPGGGIDTSAPFSDISGHWARGQITYLAGQGIVTGYPDGSFRPDSQVTRGEAAALIARALEIGEDESAASAYTDAAGWYAGYIGGLTKAGLLLGYPDRTFRPQSPITRAEFTLVLVRAVEQGLVQRNESGSATFSDSASFPAWAAEGIARAARFRLIFGYEDGAFRPLRLITRAEAAVLLYRLISP